MALALKFGDYDLNDFIETQDEGMPTRLNAQQVPKRHGVLIGEVPVLGARTIRVRGRMFSTDGTPETLRDQIRALEYALGTTRQKFYYFSDRYYWAYKSNLQWSYVEGSAALVATVAIEFLCDDPFEYSGTAPAAVDRVITSGDTVVDITANIYKEQFTITYAGTGFVYFRSKVTADQGNQVIYSIIRNLTTGRNNQFTGTLQMSKELIIDNSAFTVLNDSVNDLKDWNGSWLWLVPGNNLMEIEGNPASYEFTYQNRYL